MNPVKILFLSPFFYPETISTGKYNTVLVQALIQRGAAVDVVASHPSYPAWRPLRSDCKLHGANIHRGGAWVRYPGSMLLRRLVSELWFTGHAVRKSWTLRKDATIAVAVFPPSLFFVVASYLLPTTTKRIGIVHDLQGILGLNDGGRLNRLLRLAVHAVERKAFRSCDRLIVLSHGMARTAIAEFGLDGDRVAVYYPFVTVRASKGNGTRLAHLLPEQLQHVVYSGALGKKQNPFGLIEFYKAAVSQLPDVHFHFFSDGPLFEQMRRMHAADPVDRIHYHSLVSESDVEELYARSTVQLIPQLEGSADACLPSKLPNILAMGCMVLVICESHSELARVLEQTHTGMAVDSWEIPVLVERLKQVLKLTKLQSRAQRQALAEELLSSRFSLGPLVDAVLGQAGGKRTEAQASAAAARELGLEPIEATPERGASQ